ncbi:MAG: Uma2 family endonuclease [Eubacterium sp.]|nr:Uma2 family endonuclease [Eubacterium sp.]
MTIDEMKNRKKELGLTNEMLARQAGVPVSTVQKIFGGVTKSPRKLTLEALQRVLETSGTRRGPDSVGSRLHGTGSSVRYTDTHDISPNKLGDPGLTYKVSPNKCRYTIDDYYSLPDDQRVELIDGVFYDMETPAMIHQKILGDLYVLFRRCADHHDMPCEVYLSPCDVRLDMDNYTMVQPDLLVICRDYDIHAIRYEGAPDLVVEILSPSTRSKDMILKLYKYQNAGVREYWIVDPKFQTVTVHSFDEEEYQPRTYDFNSKIPIAISGGECEIDFSMIMDGIRRYYE